ncbi:MAG: GTP-binding protein [Candidatus Heimdallarchaeota archaeon]|nr:GTP-binding protein [Candidatus Heimdallarchaeota archaeon]MDH5646882.1 GTP-binding protein [Candidatus Heimdallarchaeota archaeon]
MPLKEFDYAFKLVLLGDGAVGKTSLVRRYVDSSFKKEYLMTIGMEPKTKFADIYDKKICFQIFDIAGQKSFKTLREMFYRGTRGAIITFDLTNYESYSNVEMWINELRKNVKNPELVLVGNKNDLESDREISKNEGDLLAQNLNCKLYVETSALTGDNVEEVFVTLGKSILDSIK